MQDAVGADGTAGSQYQQISLADLLRPDVSFRALLQNGDSGLCQQGQPFDLPLGFDLLYDAHDGIDENDRNKENFFPRTDRSQGNCNQQIQQIEYRADIVPQNLWDRFCRIVHENSS